jgi:hypothetical protein
MQKIIVAKVEKKPTSKGGTMVAVWDAEGTRFSGFLKGLQDVQEGDTIEADIEVKGDFNNIKAVTILGRGTGPRSPAAPTEEPAERRAAIECEVAIKEIGRCLAARVPVPETAVPVYWAWVSKHAGFKYPAANFYVAPFLDPRPVPPGPPVPPAAPEKPMDDEIVFPEPGASQPESAAYKKATEKPLITAEQLKELKNLKETYKLTLMTFIKKINSTVTAVNELTKEEAERILADIKTTLEKKKSM